MTEAEKLRASIGKTVARLFKELGEVMPVLHMVDDMGNHIPIHWATGFARGEKDKTAQIMRDALREAHAVRYAFATEAWIVDPKHGDWKSAVDMQQRGESIENHPDRWEVISIFVEDRQTKECLSRMYRILRPEHGKPTLAPPVDRSSEPKDISGRFFHMFE